MYVDIDDINVERLRNDLIEYFGSAMNVASPVAMMDLVKVENASDEQVVRIALSNGFDLNNYYNKKQI